MQTTPPSNVDEVREAEAASRGANDPMPTVHPTARDACREAIRAYLVRMRTFEPGIVEDRDPECLHQYRIALRKIRSLLKTFLVPINSVP